MRRQRSSELICFPLNKHDHYAHKTIYLTKCFSDEGWSWAGWQVDAEVVDWCSGQRHCNSHQRIDGVAVERHHHQEYAAQAVNDWEEQRQLQERSQEEEGEEGDDEAKMRKKKVEKKVVGGKK